ncbi:MAG: hypothetical protein JSW27_16080, partial [Phycisphaerales bacterium]
MVPSILNDVIGPVMRGPSSSHCAAALRIGRLARDLMDGRLQRVVVEFDRHGSLATTHESQGSDMGLFAGLMGWDATDDRLPRSAQALVEAGVKIDMRIVDLDATHPNTYRLTLTDGQEQHTLTALSIGGGMIEIVDLDGFRLSAAGDYWETLIFAQADGPALQRQLTDNVTADAVLLHQAEHACLVEVKAQEFVADALVKLLKEQFDIRAIRRLHPVLPILSRADLDVPFTTCEQMLGGAPQRDLPLWQLAVAYESARGSLSEHEVLQRMIETVRILRRSVAEGLNGTEYEDRILGCQSRHFARCMESKALLDGG